MGLQTILLCLSAMLAVTVAYSPPSGTTQNITDVLIGRCEEYRKCLLGDPCLPSYRQVNCESAVESFLGAVRNVDPCYTPYDAFDEFLNMVPPTTRPGKTMFWSGVLRTNLPQDIGQVTPDYTVLEETFTGYMAGNLSWCGATDGQAMGSGLNFTMCPTKWNDPTCPNNTRRTFWENASKMFAQQAVGEVFVVLNAQRKNGAFSNESVFAGIESRNLDVTKVTNIAIYLIPDFDKPTPNNLSTETCTTGSVLYLQNYLRNMKFNVTCKENPAQIMWLQCARYSDRSYCVPYYNHGTPVVTVSIAAVLLQVIFALFFGSRN